MPFDLWMYDYALHVFEARWKQYLGHKDVKVPEPPDLPDMKCKSTVTPFICENAEKMGSFEYNKYTQIKYIFHLLSSEFQNID